MDYKIFFNDYSDSIFSLLKKVDTNLINQSIDLILKKNNSGNTVFLVGNGGSASIASHVCVDFIKSAKINSSTFNDSNFITCFANDYGHENWITEAIKSKCANGDLIILISSSGKSPNIINAAKYCNNNKIDLITLSGFSKNNELKSLGNINFYVNSENYNHIEMVHHIILVSMVDIIAKKKI